MSRGQIGTLSLNSCGSFIRYSPPALTDAFPVPFVVSRLTGLAAQRTSNTSPKRKRVRSNPKSTDSWDPPQTLFDE